jgi:hypothetical protein
VPKLCRDAFQDTVRWYLTELDSKIESPYLKRLEAVLLSLMYNRGKLKEAKDFHWHIIMSDVHDVREAFMHEIETNTYTLVSSKTTVTREDGVKINEKFDTFRPIKFFTKLQADFVINGRQKRINVVIINAKYEAISSMEIIYRGGFKNLVEDWLGSIFSLAGVGTLLFAVMIFLMMVGSRTCE